jgi:hypothetical protein
LHISGDQTVGDAVAFSSPSAILYQKLS